MTPRCFFFHSRGIGGNPSVSHASAHDLFFSDSMTRAANLLKFILLGSISSHVPLRTPKGSRTLIYSRTEAICMLNETIYDIHVRTFLNLFEYLIVVDILDLSEGLCDLGDSICRHLSHCPLRTPKGSRLSKSLLSHKSIHQ